MLRLAIGLKLLPVGERQGLRGRGRRRGRAVRVHVFHGVLGGWQQRQVDGALVVVVRRRHPRRGRLQLHVVAHVKQLQLEQALVLHQLVLILPLKTNALLVDAHVSVQVGLVTGPVLAHVALQCKRD